MENYYRLYLTHDENSFLSADDNKVKITVSKDDQPVGIFNQQQVKVLVIGEEIDGVMYDVITGRKVQPVDTTTVLPYLTYYQKENAKVMDLINLSEMLDEQFCIAYGKALDNIVKNNKSKYEKYIAAKDKIKNFRSR